MVFCYISRMKRLIFLFSCLLFWNLNTWSLFEVSGQYGLNKQVYGSQRQNDIEEKSLGASFAVYLFKLTALELNYNESETITNERNAVSIDDTYRLTSQRNRVFVYSYGIGLRQVLSSRKARIRPSLSMGYARQFVRDTTVATFENVNTKAQISSTEPTSKSRYDSVFGTFSLDFKLTNSLAIRGSVHTIFKAFEFNRAGDNIRYMAGFSWYL